MLEDILEFKEGKNYTPSISFPKGERDSRERDIYKLTGKLFFSILKPKWSGLGGSPTEEELIAIATGLYNSIKPVDPVNNSLMSPSP